MLAKGLRSIFMSLGILLADGRSLIRALVFRAGMCMASMCCESDVTRLFSVVSELMMGRLAVCIR